MYLRHRPKTPALLGVAAALVVMASAQPATAARASAAAPAVPVVAWGTTTSAPAGFRGTLLGVAAATPTDVWAVGADNPDQPASQVLDRPYAEHWDGAAWTATPVAVPSLYGSHQAAELTGVTAVGPGDAWAVGDVSDLWSVASQTLAYHWNGQAWSRVATPNPGGATGTNRLHAVAARTRSDVWAVGESGFPGKSLVLHWSGAAWSALRTPDIGALQAVAVDPASVWVASAGRVQRFDGARWTTLPALPVTAGDGLFLHGLAKNAAGLWAVGTLSIPYFDGYLYRSYAAVFNGTGWTTAPAPGTGLDGIAASGSTVLVAGSNDGVFRLTTSGSTQEVTPAPGTVFPDAIAAGTSGNAWAVGFAPNGSGQTPGIINAPGIGQGGIIVTAGAGNATITWTGPVSHSGTADPSGHFSVGGLPAGTYTVISSYGGCTPGVATVTVTAGIAASVDAHVTC